MSSSEFHPNLSCGSSPWKPAWFIFVQVIKANICSLNRDTEKKLWFLTSPPSVYILVNNLKNKPNSYDSQLRFLVVPEPTRNLSCTEMARSFSMAWVVPQAVQPQNSYPSYPTHCTFPMAQRGIWSLGYPKFMWIGYPSTSNCTDIKRIVLLKWLEFNLLPQPYHIIILH